VRLSVKLCRGRKGRGGTCGRDLSTGESNTGRPDLSPSIITIWSTLRLRQKKNKKPKTAKMKTIDPTTPPIIGPLSLDEADLGVDVAGSVDVADLEVDVAGKVSVEYKGSRRPRFVL
jgi:hypothetical protein